MRLAEAAMPETAPPVGAGARYIAVRPAGWLPGRQRPAAGSPAILRLPRRTG